MTNCIISHLAPRDAKRRTKRNPARKRAKRLKHQYKKRNGRKPRKSYESTKYMDHVLSYINDDVAYWDDFYSSTMKDVNVTFDSIYQTANARGVHMLQYAFTKDSLAAACDKEFVDVIKPNLTEEKFVNLDLNRLHVWRKIVSDAKLTWAVNGLKEEARQVVTTLGKFSKQDLLALNSIMKFHPTLYAWHQTGCCRDSALGEKAVFTVEDARKFTKQVKSSKLENKLYLLSELFAERPWNERMDHLFNEANDIRWNSSKCVDCKVELWNHEMMAFRKTHVDTPFPDCQSRRCLDCIVKRVKENREQKRTTFSCGKECNCFLQLDRVSTRKSYAYFSNHLDLKEEDLKTTIAEDFESLVVASYRSLPEKLSAPSSDQNSLVQVKRYLSKLCWGDHMSLLSDEVQEELSGLRTKVDNILKMQRLRKNMENLDNVISQVVAATVSKNDEEMLASVKNMVDPIRSVLRERPSSNDEIPKVFGISMLDIANSKLQRAKDVAATSFSIAKQCAICTDVVSQRSENEALITLHDDFEKDVATWDHRFNSTCHACKDCFGNFLNFKQSLGKPMLRCPGMNCRCFLDKKRVKAALPDAFADYKTAMMRFSLKRVENYRTCPNADCAAGIVLDSCCTAEQVTCTACDTSFCPQCNDVPHEGMTCEELQRKRHAERWGEAKDYMKNETKQCPYCLVWIEKNGGCNHMTCHHCRGEFCWLCFGEWKTHNSCESSNKVTRRPFNELFPDWQRKDKTLKARFHVGRYVTVEPHTDQHVGRVVSIREHGMYHIQAVHTSEANTSSIHGTIIVEESLMRGYNGPIPVEDNAAELEEETYLSFLAGFDLDETEKIKEEPYISVELTLKDASDSESGDTSLDEEMPFLSFMKGFDDSDDEDSDDDDLVARLDKLDSFRFYENSHKLLQEKLKLKTLSAQKKIRATRERNREGCDFDSSDSDEEESEIAPAWLLFINNQPCVESDSEEESSTCDIVELFSDSDSASEDLGFESDDEEESS